MLELLVRTRLDMEPEFAVGRKKSFLWGKVLDRMSIIYPDLQMTWEDVAKKYHNMVITCKRIKYRNATGRNATCWEHFDDFEEIKSTPPKFAVLIEVYT